MEDPKDVKIRELEAEVRRLQQLVDELLGRLSKNSSNSSKPPSSDIVSPSKTSNKSGKKPKRNQGAQKGHKRILRVDFTPDQIDDVRESTISRCPDCGGFLSASETSYQVSRQVELVEKPFRVVEYRRRRYCCKKCGKHGYAPLPEGTFSGLFDPKLKALVAWMKGAGRLSFQTLQRFLRALFHVDVSTGYLANVVREVSDSLEAPYEKISAVVRNSEHIHCDETGLKENGKKNWSWVFRADNATAFRIARSRGSQVLSEFFGDQFSGTISCDFYGSYRKFAKTTLCRLQFCWARLIREYKYIADKTERKASRFGKRIVRKIQEMFSMIHRRDDMKESEWKRHINFRKNRLLESVQRGVPNDKDAKNLVDRLLQNEANYFRFIDEPIPPTNNPAEQAIRKITISRKISLGTRSDWGARWLERFCSVETTCEQRGENLLDFITKTLTNYLRGASASASFIS